LTSEISKLVFFHREPKTQRQRFLSFCQELQEKQALPVNCYQVALRMVEKGISSRPQVGDFQVAIRDIQMNFYRITRTIRLFYRKIHVIVAANTTTECPVFFFYPVHTLLRWLDGGHPPRIVWIKAMGVPRHNGDNTTNPRTRAPSVALTALSERDAGHLERGDRNCEKLTTFKDTCNQRISRQILLVEPKSRGWRYVNSPVSF